MITSVLTLSPSIHIRPMLFMSFLQKITRISNMAGQGRSSDCCWAAKINFGSGITHTTREVAVHRCQCAFSRRQDTEVPSDTRAAARSTDRGSGLRKDLQVTEAHCLKID